MPDKKRIKKPLRVTLPDDVRATLEEWNATIEENRSFMRGPKFGISRVLTGVVRMVRRTGFKPGDAKNEEDIEQRR